MDIEAHERGPRIRVGIPGAAKQVKAPFGWLLLDDTAGVDSHEFAAQIRKRARAGVQAVMCRLGLAARADRGGLVLPEQGLSRSRNCWMRSAAWSGVFVPPETRRAPAVSSLRKNRPALDILLVDDNPVNRRLASMCLRRGLQSRCGRQRRRGP